MRNLRLSWKKIFPKLDPKHATGKPCGRSSHGVSWIPSSSQLVVYGGEHVARTPLEAHEATWSCDFVKDGADEDCQWRSIDSSPPPLRVAHAQVVHEASSTVYVFGGRLGIAMEEAAKNDLWKLDCSGPPGTETWSEVIPVGDHIPEARSFHQMVCLGDSLYVFGGCGAHHGRLNDLHRFDLATKTWHDLGASQHLRGRGGAALLTLQGGQKLGVVAGFAGEETNDGHAFDVETETWAETSLNESLSGLRPRSVCVGGSFPGAGVALLFGGEVDPSAKGHEGAGGFENDLVVLEESTGRHLETIPQKQGEVPEPRGWTDGAVVPNESGGFFYVFGGLSGDDVTPKRLDDLWKLQVSQA